MRQFILGFLLALSASSIAITTHPDGSQTLTKEEADSLLASFQKMAADAEQFEKDRQLYDSDRAIAYIVLMRMKARIEELEQRKCM